MSTTVEVVQDHGVVRQSIRVLCKQNQRMFQCFQRLLAVQFDNGLLACEKCLDKLQARILWFAGPIRA